MSRKTTRCDASGEASGRTFVRVSRVICVCDTASYSLTARVVREVFIGDSRLQTR